MDSYSPKIGLKKLRAKGDCVKLNLKNAVVEDEFGELIDLIIEAYGNH